MNETQLASKGAAEAAKRHNWRRPHYKVAEDDNAFTIRVTLAGVSKDGVDIEVDGDTLSITGTRTHGVPEGWRSLRRELPEGDYRLNLRLNVPVNEEKIRAEVADGVLVLTLPKADEVKPRKIRIA